MELEETAVKEEKCGGIREDSGERSGCDTDERQES